MMDNIKKKIDFLRNKLVKEKETDKKIRSVLKEALNKAFNSNNASASYLNDCSINEKKIILETKTKTCANEFFLRKEQILTELAKEGVIREIVIK